ncbi:hypothetical protein RN001_011159 [Aquatica leii]|uniref:Uncharacterized protein n=1 Tax=Aquatica leii TaxID=1421715 RepID=A0AAN7SNM4_9COLE|nr:hypothetical protein RN001_011159 [Aquatica leii]
MCDCSDLYCSQQINIPPTFPYLLRQYAKAAIRTQPTDLLRWSTAYFRCLSLNLPPPVKPRLEYPIPKAYFGLTPGWLKALMCQLSNNLTVPFQVLWDRWIGACMQHEHLINLLVLSGFKDPYAIPWLEFVGICAGHLTDNLTNTMILFCEIITEEPEGGSAMVPLEIFLTVYKLLANIDASNPQTLLNLYFTDALLALFRQPSVVESKESTVVLEEEIVEEEVVAEEEKVVEVDLGPAEDLVGVVISCPDIAVDNYKTEEDFLSEAAQPVTDYESPAIPPEVLALENVDLEKEMKDKGQDVMSTELGDSVETLIEELKNEPGEEEEMLVEDDYELQQLKEILEMQPELKQVDSDVLESDVTETKLDEIETEKGEEEPAYVYIDTVFGIGAKVPDEMIEAVFEYMKECSKVQKGMVMPRNIRHFNCPPLEVLPL